MKPIMKPPPIIKAGNEETTIIVPQAFLFEGLSCNIKEESKTKAPHISPTAVRPINGPCHLMFLELLVLSMETKSLQLPKL